MECELPEFYQCYERKASKGHRCCECSAPINKGETYVVATGKWDGDLRTYKQHLLCAKACMYIRDNLNDGECISFEGLWEWVSDARWECDKTHPVWRDLRKMLAQIKYRERTEHRAPSRKLCL